jgi:hypothetical protein
MGIKILTMETKRLIVARDTAWPQGTACIIPIIIILYAS